MQIDTVNYVYMYNVYINIISLLGIIAIKFYLVIISGGQGFQRASGVPVKCFLLKRSAA